MHNSTVAQPRRARDSRADDLAVIGMACRFPQANNYQEYWKNLVAGRVCIGEIPPARWRWQDYWGDPQTGDNRCNSRWGGFIDDVDAFDLGFFGMSAREVESMDPQQRLGLELAWTCFEDAGIRPSALSGRSVGVFVGVANLDYKELTETASPTIDAYYATGIAASVLSNRISYYFNFRGPSVPVDTACSSALYAIHAACQAIREGECEEALAGGISLLLTPRRFICFARSKMLSPSGAIRAFDADADGMVRGEGGGFILLKPLARALDDGDRIIGVVRGSAVNHSGRTYSLTYPSAAAQAEVISKAQEKAGVAPSEITYIEAHGTGTPKGDPIELEGLVRAFRLADAARGCSLGSAKPNVGHLEAAAGIAGVIKVLLSMQHRTLPPLANFKQLNPRAPQGGDWFRIATSAEEWTTRAGDNLAPLPRLAGVSAFGFAGTNAHVVLEESPVEHARAASSLLPWNVLCLSAKTEAALARKQREMAEWLEEQGGRFTLSEICAGLAHGREHFAVRAAVVARTAAEMAESLRRSAAVEREGLYVGGCVPFDDEGRFLYRPDEALPLADPSHVSERELPIYLGRLAREYVKGMSPDDWGLYDRADRARVPLPTYPFEKTRCWVAGDARSAQTPRTESETAPRRLMLFDENWSPRSLKEAPTTSDKPSVLVCFVATPLHQRLVAETLSRLDPALEVVFVNRGVQAGKRSQWEYGASGVDGAEFRAVLDEIARDFEEVSAVWYCWELHSTQGDAVDERCFDSVVALIRALHESSLRTRRLLLAAPAADGAARCFYEGWLGLERSLRTAGAGLSVVPVYLDTGAGLRPCVEQLWREEVADTRVAVRYAGGERMVASVEPLESAGAGDASVIRQGGAYLITGGMGGLGQLFARHLAEKYGARVVVTGRSARDGVPAETAAGEIRYRQADVSDRAAMSLLLEEVRREWGPLNGLIHAAGVEDRVLLLEKDGEQLRRVLAPKVAGALVLDELLADTPLDFVCYFSSLAAVLGDFGVGAYAVANRFLMSHARYRRALEERGERYGKTLAVVWPLWREGVMGFESEQEADAYLRSSGQRMLETDEGLAVFESLLAQTHVHPIVVAGTPGVTDAFIGARRPASPARPWPEPASTVEAQAAAVPERKTAAPLNDPAAEENLIADLKKIAGDVLRVSPEHLDSSSSFTDFGFESISLMEFAARLTERFGLEVTPTVFFSYSTFARLAQHFIGTYYEAVGRLYAAADDLQTAASAEEPSAAPPEAMPSREAAAVEPVRPNPDPGVPAPIAIVGMSGRFPKARDVEEMWSILENGLEAVEEIHPRRFDWRDYFDESGQGRGKIGTKWTGSVPGVDEFDSLFFEIAPHEAERMDPRERLLLQEAWHALEDAGYGEKRLRASSIGMFVGAEGSDYASLSDEPGSIVSNHNGILAARLGYFLDFKGPNMAINTACSSGLVAVHLACQSLQLGECDVAIAAGVNLMLDPALYVKLSEAGMLSPDGRCYAFDHRANGIVPGEAVVAVVLKPLDKALAEHDSIYAVIRGSGINYDGKTNGITAPSGEAQARLIESVYARHRIDPDRLGYVVAHGTGTKLGDPVEVNALNDAFSRFTSQTGFCALTSSKTNFGHTFAASGLVSLVGLVQAMRRGRIPPSLYWEVGNEFVNWQASPFFVNASVRPWPDDGRGRWGAVSAFGMSGTNAHVVVEGYEPPRRAARAARPSHSLFVLSAKTEEALRRKAEELAAFLDRTEVSDEDLPDISHTLLNGRLHFQRRYAFVAASVRQARELLARLGSGPHADLFESRADEDRPPPAPTQEYVRYLRAQAAELQGEPARLRETLRALADLYCRGADLTDEPAANAGEARTIRLPGYPFAREQHWVTPSAPPSEAQRLHPLVSRNVSDFAGQSYGVRLTGGEFCLRDHVIGGRRILPGSAHLEMARFSVEAAAGVSQAIEFRDVVWAELLAVPETGREVEIRLRRDADGLVEYRLVSDAGDGGAERVHSYGKVRLREAGAPERVDLERLKAECRAEVFDAEELYRRFRQMGIEYGPSHRGVVRVFVGREKILAQLELPHVETDEGAACKLHPGMLDSAFQASLVLTGTGDQLTPALPFGLEQLEFHAACSRKMWAHAQVSARGRDGQVRQLDLDLVNEAGEVCARLRGFVSRPATVGRDDARTEAPHAATTLRHPVWRAQPLDGSRAVRTVDAERRVLLLGSFAGLASTLEGTSEISCEPLAHAPQAAPDEEFADAAASLFRRVKALLSSKPVRPVLLQVVCAAGEQAATNTARGLLGLLKTAHLENPRFFGQLVEAEPTDGAAELLAILADAARQGSHVRYTKGQRLVPVWETVDARTGAEPAAWRADGVYLISGGAGGIGLRLARELIEHCGRAKVLLVGRTPLRPALGAELRALDGGGRLRYVQADISNRAQVQALVDELRASDGLHGVIHCAGVIRDSFIVNKDEDEFREVLKPKAGGVVCLDEATRDCALDFFVCFSSLAGVFGNAGQADYAAANAFLDAYMERRQALVEAGLRSGRSVSIQWPLWESGGMRVERAFVEQMAETRGLTPLDTASGLSAFYAAVAADRRQVMVTHGDQSQVGRWLEEEAARRAEESGLPRAAELKTPTPSLLRETLAAVAGVRLEEIDAEADIGEYGLDRHAVARLAEAINERAGLSGARRLDAASIVEHGNLRRLADYLAGAGPARNATADDGPFRQQAEEYVKRLLAQSLKLPASKLEAKVALEKYGINSLMIVRLNSHFEEHFGPLPKTLLFEYQTIEELTGYFVENHAGTLKRLTGTVEAESKPGAAVAVRNDAEPRRSTGQAAPRVRREADTLEIAIIGLAGRYPQARNVEEFARNLREGRDCVTEVPAERWDHSRYFDPDKTRAGKTYSKWGGFIDGVDEFDPLFFQISPRDAELMDPQERLFLQCAYETLEDAGYTRQSLSRAEGGVSRNVGVYVGVMYEEYQLYGAQATALGHPLALAGNPSSIANRVSYHFNFHGPSMAVDTMCSSSLTAIHLACQSLQRGECEVALAGGVNVSIHPNKYLMLGQNKFVSSKGRCESFGEGGDGYVPAEGVGAVLLKPLAEAERDGDHIYGVIRGTAVNHGGKTNGYTVPNPNAQSAVIETALREAGVEARTVSYVEAHGTGTSLGDPIELAGLVKAFRAGASAPAGSCALGSVKSNMGHAESAAGIAGLTKVLLQMRERALFPSLHAETLNPNIDFDATPFVVQRTLSEWRRPVLEVGGTPLEFPRIAGVSSFGAGGSNAHLLVCEYAEAETAPRREGSLPVVVVLSAKDEERLRERAEQLSALLKRNAYTEVDLPALAYTLQVGRETMEERLAFTASSLAELSDKLTLFLEQGCEAEGLFCGQVKAHRQTLGGLAGDDDAAVLIDAWMRKGKLSKVLDLWAKGVVLDWAPWYGADAPLGERPRRLSLPPYPFARTRYWVSLPELRAGEAKLHPLLHTNTSVIARQRFSTRFEGSEFFLKDHRIEGRAVLPGVAYLEMARRAVELSLPELEAGSPLRLARVVWREPFVVGEEGATLHIELRATPDDGLAFEIYSHDEDARAARRVHCEGVAAHGREIEPPARVDLSALRQACELAAPTAQACYEAFTRMGIDYGPAHRSLEELWIGPGQVLARLHLPRGAAETESAQFLLHPSMLDGALQAAIALGGDPEEARAELPFALSRLDVLGLCSQVMWARVEVARAQADSRTLNVSLYDEAGDERVRMLGFISRPVRPRAELGEAAMPVSPRPSATTDEPIGDLLLAPVWRAETRELRASPWPDEGQVLLSGATFEQRALLERRFAGRLVYDDGATGLTPSAGPISHVIFVAPATQAAAAGSELLIEGQREGVLRLFRLVKSLLSAGYGARELTWTIVTEQTLSVNAGETNYPAHASVHGLAGVMAKEHARWAVRLVDVERGTPWPLEELFALPADADADVWAHRRGQWYRRELLQVQAADGAASSYRRGGVYVVVGGAGGIGRVWSEQLIRNFDARIVWLGRRPHDAEIQAAIDALAAHGQPPLYIQADATDAAALRAALDTIERRYGTVNGVVHSALVLRDQSLANMDEEVFRQALKAKVDVSVRLAQVFGPRALDFILFFSSFISFSRVAGQSNYAAGCTFKDAYAQHLSGALGCAVKVVNWGYWGETGAVASPTHRQRMARLGIGSIETPVALKTLDLLLAGPLDQLALIRTTRGGVVGQMSAAERLAVQPRREGASLARLVERLPSHGERVAELRASGGLQGTEFDELLVPLLWGLLNRLGSFAGSAAAPEWRERLGILPSYARWFEESLAVLAERGLLVADGDKVRASGVVESDELSAAWRRWEAAAARWAEQPPRRARLALLEATLRALPDILTGRAQATDIVFPGASMALVEGIYKGNEAADFFNQLVAQLAAAHAALHDDAARPLRILEVGAGTGGTSAAVLAALRPYGRRVGEYCYTDISKAFLTHAEREYGREFPFLTYRLFDVTRPLAPQGIDEGGFDLLIATNVLHATPDIRRTLRNCKAALADRGVLLLNEISDKSLFTHLTFGLLKGWWSFEDSRLRLRGCPALHPEVWRRVLAEEGFETTLLPVPEAQALGQQVIAAQSDGVTLQPFKPAPAQPPQVAQQPAPARIAAALVPAAPARPDMLRRLRQTVLELLAGALKVEAAVIDPDESFADYGLDSIIGVSVAQAVNEALGITLETTSLFEHHTVNQLAEHILEQFGDALNNSPQPAQGRPHIVDEATPAHAPAGQLRTHVEETIVRLLSESLKVAPAAIDPDEPFADFGLDSIVGVDLARRLGDALAVELETTTLFDYSTVNRLTEHILLSFEGTAPTPAALMPSPAPDEERPRPARALTPAGDVAIVGVSLHFPQARDLDEFWQRLVSGESCIGEVPTGRLKKAGGADSSSQANWRGGFIEHVERFDPLFFNISPQEARLMDPQQRLLLTHAWRAVEDAGIAPKALAQARTGVFVAAGSNEYMGTVSVPGASPFAMTATAPSLIPNRISYLLNLRGPSEYYDTACSSGLVALHRAVQSLKQGECEQAIVGAVNLLLAAEKFEGFEAMGFLSTRGEVKSFQAEADGFVRSEGVAALVLKPLATATADGSFIYGVIKGTGVEHGGKGVSLTAPNAAGIRTAVAFAYRAAGFDPQTVSYIEAHGVGSPLGDAIELNALKAAYAELAAAAPAAAEPPTCYVGSLKPVFGHGELVSGLMAVCKVLMAFRHRTIPGLPGWGSLNQNISLEGTPLKVAEENRRWETQGARPRRAGVNSFGFGGVNAHLLLEEYVAPEGAPVQDASRGELIVLSAKSFPQLREAGARLLAYVRKHPAAVLRDVAHTLQTGRRHFEWRAALWVKNPGELEAGLRRLASLKEEESGRLCDVPPLYLGRAAGRDADEAGEPALVSAPFEEAALLGRAEELAEHWVRGADVPWHLLPGHAHAAKVPLPTYPFAEERYWLEDTASLSLPRAAALTNGELEERVEEELRALLSKELGLEPHAFESKRPLREYGADSVLDLRLIRHLEQRFGVRLTVSELFEQRTLEGVSRHVAGTVRDGGACAVHEDEAAPDAVVELLERFKRGEVALDEMMNLV